MAIAGRVAIVPKGEWDSSISYEKLDVVSYNNALYMAKKPSVGQVPADGEYWMLCVQSIDYSEFEKIINGTTTVGIADKAINDKNGDDIVDTYAKKNDLTNFQNKDGDSKDNTVTFESSDSTTADSWTDVAVLATGEKHSSIFAKISTMFKNIRYIYTHFIKSENILDTLEEIVANTQSGKVAGALAVKELNSNLVNIDTELLNYTDVTGNKNSFVNSGSAFFYSKTGNKVCVQCYGSVNANVSMNAILCSNFPAPVFGYGVLTITNLSTGTSGTCTVNSLGQLCAVEAILSSGNAFAISGSYICKL